MGHITFGVELEAAFFYSSKPDHNTDSESRNTNYARVVDMSFEAIRSRDPNSARPTCEREYIVEMMKLVARTINNFVDRLPHTYRGRVVSYTGKPELDWYRRWRVETDSSIVLDKADYDNLDFAGLEIQSPAMYATHGASREIKAVTNMLRVNFRTAVPHSCGLHVHVGAGFDFLPLETLRKLAAICWAGDHLLHRMHSQCRRHNGYCLGPRIKSKLAYGRKAGHYNPPYDLPHPLPSVRHHYMSPIEHEIHTRAIYSELMFNEPFEEVHGINVMSGSLELLLCRSRNAVACLMDTDLRGAYNFDHYGDFDKETKDDTKRTVEFRQADGSMDGD
ncbi:putative amidoligase enzyme-domain-containing protein [Jackrogersella minutella]|nr:putative amidoligase enzyme-domain-containing protein [Jackrogersella minutella]